MSIMHHSHPLLYIYYYLQHLHDRKKADLIPKDTMYCCGHCGANTCPFVKEHYGNNHGLSPFNGFNWCTYLNAGDYPEFNDLCKICDIEIPEFDNQE
jgi:hypothetical protein